MFFDLNDNLILDMENLGPCTAGRLPACQVGVCEFKPLPGMLRFDITKEKLLPWPLEMRLC